MEFLLKQSTCREKRIKIPLYKTPLHARIKRTRRSVLKQEVSILEWSIKAGDTFFKHSPLIILTRGFEVGDTFFKHSPLIILTRGFEVGDTFFKHSPSLLESKEARGFSFIKPLHPTTIQPATILRNGVH